MCQFWCEEYVYILKIYILGLLFTTRVDLRTLERVHVLLSNFCGNNGFSYIDNRNTKGDTHHAYTSSNREILVKEGNIGSVSSGFEALRENILKYINNQLIGYLNINSLTNKIVDLREIILELLLDYLVLSETKLSKAFL